MKVLHVLDHSAPNYDGYAMRSAEIIRFQREIGIETAQVTSAKHGASAHDVEEIGGLRYHRTRAEPGFASRLPLLGQWDVVQTLKARLREVIADEAPDIIHAHSPSLNGLAALGAVGGRIPLVYEARAFWEDAAVDKGVCREGDLRYRMTRWLESRVVARASRVVCIPDLWRRGVVAIQREPNCPAPIWDRPTLPMTTSS